MAQRKNVIPYYQTPKYRSWRGAMGRCHNPRDIQFIDYGGRGIKVCERWQNSFQDFLADMGKKPNSELSLDRINNDGNYEPLNCRWATKSEQVKNKRRFKSISVAAELTLLREIEWLKDGNEAIYNLIVELREKTGWKLSTMGKVLLGDGRLFIRLSQRRKIFMDTKLRLQKRLKEELRK